MTDPWLSTDGIASHRGVTTDIVCTWFVEKDMPALKLGRLWKPHANDVGDYVRRGGAARRRKSAWRLLHPWRVLG